jgi:hypothetical protein
VVGGGSVVLQAGDQATQLPPPLEGAATGSGRSSHRSGCGWCGVESPKMGMRCSLTGQSMGGGRAGSLNLQGRERRSTD